MNRSDLDRNRRSQDFKFVSGYGDPLLSGHQKPRSYFDEVSASAPVLAGSPGFVGRQTPIDDSLDCTDGFQIPPADVTSVARGKPKGARRRQMSTGSSSSMSDFDDDVTSSKGRPDSAGVKSKQFVLINNLANKPKLAYCTVLCLFLQKRRERNEDVYSSSRLDTSHASRCCR